VTAKNKVEVFEDTAQQTIKKCGRVPICETN